MFGNGGAGGLQMAHHHVTADARYNATEVEVIEHLET